MNNWLEYIDYLLFNVNLKKKELDNGLLSIILENGVEFDIYLSSDNMIIYDLLYWHCDSIKESEEFKFYLGEGDFSEKNRETVKKIFSVPIFDGWTDIHYLYNKEIVKIERYYGVESKKEDQVSYKFRLKPFANLFLLKKEIRIVEIKPVKVPW